MITFSDQIRPLIPLGPFRDNRDRLQAAIDGLIADGGTAFYDATAVAFERVRSLRGRANRISAVVVLSDGEDIDSRREPEEVLEQLDQADTPNPVRVFTIAYSVHIPQAREALEGIAAASGGQSYTGDTGDIENVYRSISSFF